jgi:hypothetical protein
MYSFVWEFFSTRVEVTENATVDRLPTSGESSSSAKVIAYFSFHEQSNMLKASVRLADNVEQRNRVNHPWLKTYASFAEKRSPTASVDPDASALTNATSCGNGNGTTRRNSSNVRSGYRTRILSSSRTRASVAQKGWRGLWREYSVQNAASKANLTYWRHGSQLSSFQLLHADAPTASVNHHIYNGYARRSP